MIITCKDIYNPCPGNIYNGTSSVWNLTVCEQGLQISRQSQSLDTEAPSCGMLKSKKLRQPSSTWCPSDALDYDFSTAMLGAANGNCNKNMWRVSGSGSLIKDGVTSAYLWGTQDKQVHTVCTQYMRLGRCTHKLHKKSGIIFTFKSFYSTKKSQVS